jgi:hypothetical protein
MRAIAACTTVLLVAAALGAARARAEPAPEAEATPGDPVAAPPASRLKETERLILRTGRIEPSPAADRLSLSLHGEVALRHQSARDLKLEPPPSDPQADTLGQVHHLYDFVRLRPRLDYRDDLAVVGQLDLTRGIPLGDTARHTSAARDPFDELQWSLPAAGASFRYLYLQLRTPVGLIRVGQQGSHWGMGLLANDGDHPTLFGELRRGSLVERLLLVSRPLGPDEPLQLTVAGDLIFEDRHARLTDGDRATQLLGALQWIASEWKLGVYGGYRYQRADERALAARAPFAEWMEVGLVSLAGRFATDTAARDVSAFGQVEISLTGGSTSLVRTAEQIRAGDAERILAFGGALVVGAVHETGRDEDAWGDLVVSVELGYASGDADPGDGVTRRFTFDSNHNVGLVLFDHVLRWKTARAATIAGDPATVHRPAPGLGLHPSEGGVFGAAYLYPTLVVRPWPWLDLKGGVVVAQATADLVDPYHFHSGGDYANYDGGDERRHDLGVELVAGVDTRLATSSGLVFTVGAEGGLLLPGGAFDDAQDRSLPPQYLLTTKLGLNF